MRVITIEGGATFTPLVDGWTIQVEMPPVSSGQVMYVRNWYWATISGCGGGIYINGAQPTISNNLIYGNVAADATAASEGAGGGIYLINSAGTFIVSNEIYNNDARINGEGNGGGIFINDSGGKTSVIRNLIYGNEGSSVTTHSGGGTAVYVGSNIDQVQIYDNEIFLNNPDEWSVIGVCHPLSILY